MQLLQQRQRGEGSIYENPRSRYLWIKYYSAGKPVREIESNCRSGQSR